VLDAEAIVLRPDNTSDFEALRSRFESIAAGRYRIRVLSQLGRTNALPFQESGLRIFI